MIVHLHLRASAQEQIGAADPRMMAVLDKEVQALRSWGERRKATIADLPREEKEVRRVYLVEDRPTEVLESRMVWDLEGANPRILPEADERIVQAYRALKNVGFQRASTILACRMFDVIHGKDLASYYDGKPDLFVGAALVWKRLESTAKIVIRFDNPEKFGPYTVMEKDGGKRYDYTTKEWRSLLVKRGVLKKKKKR